MIRNTSENRIATQELFLNKNNEEHSINSRKNVSFSEDFTDNFIGSEEFSKIFYSNSRIRFEDRKTPKFNSDLIIDNKCKGIDITNIIENYSDESALYEKDFDEHHSPINLTKKKNASKFKQDYRRVRLHFVQRTKKCLNDSLYISIEEPKSNSRCSIDKIKCGCQLF